MQFPLLQYFTARYIALFCFLGRILCSPSYNLVFGLGTIYQKLQPSFGPAVQVRVRCRLGAIQFALRVWCTPDAWCQGQGEDDGDDEKEEVVEEFVQFHRDNHHHNPNTHISPSLVPILGVSVFGKYLEYNSLTTNTQYPIPIPILQNHPKNSHITSFNVGCFSVVVWEVVGYFQFPRLSAGWHVLKYSPIKLQLAVFQERYTRGPWNNFLIVSFW